IEEISEALGVYNQIIIAYTIVSANRKSLVLADNFFNGNVPNLTRLTSLKEINLSKNRFGPEFLAFLCSRNCLSTRNLSDQHPSLYCKKSTVLNVKPRF
ncbi:hypothetical protein RYX36_004916, partial [Vicia faba]